MKYQREEKKSEAIHLDMSVTCYKLVSSLKTLLSPAVWAPGYSTPFRQLQQKQSRQCGNGFGHLVSSVIRSLDAFSRTRKSLSIKLLSSTRCKWWVISGKLMMKLSTLCGYDNGSKLNEYADIRHKIVLLFRWPFNEQLLACHQYLNFIELAAERPIKNWI